jgi:hypothetical protein
VITFVYYCNVEPKQFFGGTLRLQCRQNGSGSVFPFDAYVEIDPRPNSIVFFPATTSHEVMPVSSAADGPTGLRITVNGWFRVGHTGLRAVPDVTPPTLTMLQERLVPRLGMPAFAVRPAPAQVHDVLAGLWELRSGDARSEDADPAYLPTGSPDFLDLGALGSELLEHLRPAHEEWSGRALVSTAAYGLRIYRRGQTLGCHVDRCESHVVTSVLVVRQDVERPWPLTLEIDGRAHDVHLGDGHMVTFESAAVPHGRYTPLEGDEYAILQLHYRPRDWVTSVPDLIRDGLDRGLIDRSGRPMVALVR